MTAGRFVLGAAIIALMVILSGPAAALARKARIPVNP